MMAAAALGLLDENDRTAPYGSLIQSFNRWLLSTFSSESVIDGETFHIRQSDMRSLSLDAAPSTMNKVVGMKTRTTNTCQSCDFVTSREATIHAVDLAYPRKVCLFRLTALIKSLSTPRHSPKYCVPPSFASLPPERHATIAVSLRPFTASDFSRRVRRRVSRRCLA